MLPFKQDFFEYARRNGRLPISSLEKKLKLNKKLIQFQQLVPEEVQKMNPEQLEKYLKDALAADLQKKLSMNQLGFNRKVV